MTNLDSPYQKQGVRDPYFNCLCTVLWRWNLDAECTKGHFYTKRCDCLLEVLNAKHHKNNKGALSPGIPGIPGIPSLPGIPGLAVKLLFGLMPI